jgi:hypothetical protein
MIPASRSAASISQLSLSCRAITPYPGETTISRSVNRRGGSWRRGGRGRTGRRGTGGTGRRGRRAGGRTAGGRRRGLTRDGGRCGRGRRRRGRGRWDARGGGRLARRRGGHRQRAGGRRRCRDHDPGDDCHDAPDGAGRQQQHGPWAGWIRPGNGPVSCQWVPRKGWTVRGHPWLCPPPPPQEYRARPGQTRPDNDQKPDVSLVSCGFLRQVAERSSGSVNR